MLPCRAGEKLEAHLQEVRRLHRQDLAEGYGRVRLPHALGESIPMHRWSGTGNGCFRNTIAGTTQTPVSMAAII